MLYRWWVSQVSEEIVAKEKTHLPNAFVSFSASKNHILLFKILHSKVSYDLMCGMLLNLMISFSLIIVVVRSIIIRGQLFVSDVLL
jgi:hypothetical protein